MLKLKFSLSESSQNNSDPKIKLHPHHSKKVFNKDVFFTDYPW